MKSIIKKISQGLLLVPVMLFGLSFVTVPAYAANCDPNNLSIDSGADCAQGNDTPDALFGDETSVFTMVTNVLLFLVGAISVIMLIIGGIRYVISGGDQAQVTSAKNSILYAIVGIVIAFLAYAAVNFVTGAFAA
ncbi:TPA: hypothetical protein DCF80_02625 [Candidatus Saccharibacteria bacterium]|nr:hypothetical protein [Candidatus Saccharibacteria bacterium]